MNIGGISNIADIGSAMGGALPDAVIKWQQARAALMAERERQQGQQAQGLAFDTLAAPQAAAPMPYATPMPAAMAPGQPSQPAAPPQGASPPLPPAGGPPGQPPAPGGPQPMAQPQGPPQPPTGGGQPGGLGVRDLAAELERRNPGIDKATLFQAMMHAQQALSPEGKQQMQLLLQEFKLAGLQQTLAMREQIADRQDATRRAVADENADTRRWVTRFVQDAIGKRTDQTEGGKDRRQEVSEGEKDKRQGVSEEGKDARLTTTEGGKDKRAAAATAKSQAAAEFGSVAEQIKGVKDKISDLLRGKTIDDLKGADLATYKQLAAQRDTLREKASAIKARAVGEKLPSLEEAVNAAGKKEAAPKGKYAKGDVITAPDGKKYRALEDGDDPAIEPADQ